ncbi:hypothetical protein V7150_09155 [Neobacillus drentensis]|uniref:hypothetical protein n=1 Tax=Neobacillus drentensis TaxID=220684 RepID=UPI00300011FD
MIGDTFFSIIPIITIIFYIAPIAFIIWFLVKLLKIQQEKNKILKPIADKIDKLNI